MSVEKNIEERYKKRYKNVIKTGKVKHTINEDAIPIVKTQIEVNAEQIQEISVIFGKQKMIKILGEKLLEKIQYGSYYGG